MRRTLEPRGAAGLSPLWGEQSCKIQVILRGFPEQSVAPGEIRTYNNYSGAFSPAVVIRFAGMRKRASLLWGTNPQDLNSDGICGTERAAGGLRHDDSD